MASLKRPSAAVALHTWLEDALRHERTSISRQLERRHQAILAEVASRLESGADSSDISTMLPSPLQHGTCNSKLTSTAKPLDDMAVPFSSDWGSSGVIAEPNGLKSVVFAEPSSSRSNGKHTPREDWKDVDAPNLFGNDPPPDKIGVRSSLSKSESSISRRPEEETDMGKTATESLSHAQSLFEVGTREPRNCLELLVRGKRFELLFGILITVNIFVLVLEAQMRGWLMSDSLGFAGSDAKQIDSSLLTKYTAVFDGSEFVFGILYTIEAVMRILGLRCYYFCELWNVFDLSLVAAWWLSTIGASSGMDPMFLRVTRLTRLWRLIRVIRQMRGLESLYVLIGSIKASLHCLTWSLILLFVIQLMASLFLQHMLEEYFQSDAEPFDKRSEVFRYFGTFSKSFLSMTELTLGNWIPPTRAVVDNVSEWWTFFFLFYIAVVGFTIVRVMNGVFMPHTFHVASTDDNIMVMQKQLKIASHVRKMTKLTKILDEDNNGYLTRNEFAKILEEPELKLWLAAMEVDITDVDAIFPLLDDGDGKLTISELVSGFARFKGPARQLDICILMEQVEDVRLGMRELAGKVDKEDETHKNISKLVNSLASHALGNDFLKKQGRQNDQGLFGQLQTFQGRTSALSQFN